MLLGAMRQGIKGAWCQARVDCAAEQAREEICRVDLAQIPASVEHLQTSDDDQQIFSL